MAVGVCTIYLRISHSRSLKEKRQVVNSIKDRVKSRFNVSIAEIDHLDDRRHAVLAIACVSNNGGQVNSSLSNVVNFVESLCLAEMIDYQLQLL